MTRVFGFACAALLGLCGPALAGVCHSENLMPEFFAFEARTAKLPPPVRASRFMREIAARHPEFYNDKDVDWPATLHDDALKLLDPARGEAIPGFPAFSQSRFHIMAITLDRDFEDAQTKFGTGTV